MLLEIWVGSDVGKVLVLLWLATSDGLDTGYKGDDFLVEEFYRKRKGKH